MQADQKSKSVRIYTKSTGGKENMKVLREGGQEKILALFSSLDQDGNFADNIIDESVDVEKIVETQMMIETVSNAISQETTSSLSIKLILRSTKY